ncbi:MAG: hypothetical protein WCV69_01380 [Patescibacteria group bacterium]|jgi:hypothetical protein
MTSVLSDEQYRVLDRRLDEVKRRANQGTILFNTTIDQLQCIVEGRGFECDLIHGMFATPAQQLSMVKVLNVQHCWGFTDEDFIKLGQAPVPANTTRLTVVILEVCLDTVQRTFDTAWQLAASKQPNSSRLGGLLSDSEHLRLLSGQHSRGLKWRIVDLGANQNRKSVDVRDSVQSPAAAILWMAYYSPKWVSAMNGKDIPYVFLPGYEACAPIFLDWQFVPCFGWDADMRQFWLRTFHLGSQCDEWAVPAFRE